MEDQQQPKPSLESLLLEMIANQQSIHDAVTGLYEKVNQLDRSLTGANEAQLEADLADRVDLLYASAREVVFASGKASTSYLQRKLRIGYTLAAALMDKLEEEEIIGPAVGSSPRQVLVGPDDENLS